MNSLVHNYLTGSSSFSDRYHSQTIRIRCILWDIMLYPETSRVSDTPLAPAKELNWSWHFLSSITFWHYIKVSMFSAGTYQDSWSWHILSTFWHCIKVCMFAAGTNLLFSLNWLCLCIHNHLCHGGQNMKGSQNRKYFVLGHHRRGYLHWKGRTDKLDQRHQGGKLATIVSSFFASWTFFIKLSSGECSWMLLSLWIGAYMSIKWHNRWLTWFDFAA